MNLRHCIYPKCSPDYSAHDDNGVEHLGGLESQLSLESLASVPSLSLSLSLSLSHCSQCQVDVQLLSLPSVSALALSGQLLYAAAGHVIHVYDSASLSLLHTFNSDHPSSGSVKSISFSNGRVFTAHQDSKIRVWSSGAHRLLAVLPTLSDRLLRLPLPASYVQVRRHKKQLWLRHSDAVSCLHSTPSLLYSVSWDKTLKIWKLSDPNLRCLQSLPAHQDAVNAVVVSPDGVVYTASADTRIRVWATQPQGDRTCKHALVATLQRHKSAVNALALSSDGNVLFSGACDRSILVWEREDSAAYMVVAGALRGHSNAILCLVYVSDLLLSASADRTVRIWRRGNGIGMDAHFSCFTVLEGHLKPVKSLVATCQSQLSTSAPHTHTNTLTVFSGSLDGQIRVWKLNL